MSKTTWEMKFKLEIAYFSSIFIPIPPSVVPLQSRSASLSLPPEAFFGTSLTIQWTSPPPQQRRGWASLGGGGGRNIFPTSNAVSSWRHEGGPSNKYLSHRWSVYKQINFYPTILLLSISYRACCCCCFRVDRKFDIMLLKLYFLAASVICCFFVGRLDTDR